MPQRKRGLQGAARTESRAGADHPLAGREGRDDNALQIPLTRIRPDPEQPRKHFDEAALDELAASIAGLGVLQPLIVYPKSDLYYIVAGERRYRAALRAGLDTVPARVLQDQTQILEVQLVENVQREDLPLLEEARALQRLQEVLGASVRGLEQATGKSKSYISRRLSLLKMPQDVQDMLVEAPQLFSRAEEVAKVADATRRQARIAALLRKPAVGEPDRKQGPGRPVKPFVFRRRRSGAFDLVVKYRPGESDKESLITQLRQALEDLEG